MPQKNPNSCVQCHSGHMRASSPCIPQTISNLDPNGTLLASSQPGYVTRTRPFGSAENVIVALLAVIIGPVGCPGCLKFEPIRHVDLTSELRRVRWWRLVLLAVLVVAVFRAA